MESRLCAVCGRLFEPLPQVRHQKCCSSRECQRERKRLWQQKKRASDPYYQDNQKQAAKAWAQNHPNYSREYREANPDYVEKNRTQQRARNNKRRETAIAKMDASPEPIPLQAGIYRLMAIDPVEIAKIAKMDAWIVEITILSGPNSIFLDDCKESTR